MPLSARRRGETNIKRRIKGDHFLHRATHESRLFFIRFCMILRFGLIVTDSNVRCCCFHCLSYIVGEVWLFGTTMFNIVKLCANTYKHTVNVSLSIKYCCCCSSCCSTACLVKVKIYPHMHSSDGI